MAVKKTSVSRRSLNTSETKNKLFSTALMLFTQHGFDKVKVDDIAGFAGVSKGTFYNHFATKDEVLVEQFKQIDRYYDQVFRQLKGNEDAAERMLILAKAMCDYCEKAWGLNLIKIVYGNQISLGKHPEILLNRQRSLYSILTDNVTRGRAEGIFTSAMPVEEQVDRFARGARSALYEWCLSDGSIDLEKTCRQLFLSIMDNLRRQEPGKTGDE
ncbi:MAG: TetR/AcrR family transcriptional regulator [Candidatus Accumulibacter sp.]|jgi:AcrR family transcriptional regulator|nr:TetR/AcrR family transcriptional regulator [Accumulibacter sp.]